MAFLEIKHIILLSILGKVGLKRPQVIKIGPYVIFFRLDEGKPLEPIHVHIAEGVPRENATKVWLTQSGKALSANNRSDITVEGLLSR